MSDDRPHLNDEISPEQAVLFKRLMVLSVLAKLIMDSLKAALTNLDESVRPVLIKLMQTEDARVIAYKALAFVLLTAPAAVTKDVDPHLVLEDMRAELKKTLDSLPTEFLEIPVIKEMAHAVAHSTVH